MNPIREKQIEDIANNPMVVQDIDRASLYFLEEYILTNIKWKIVDNTIVRREKDQIDKWNFVLFYVQDERRVLSNDRYHRQRFEDMLQIQDRHKKTGFISFLRSKYKDEGSNNIAILIVSLFKLGIINDPRGRLRQIHGAVRNSIDINFNYQALWKCRTWQEFTRPAVRPESLKPTKYEFKMDYLKETIELLTGYCDTNDIPYNHERII